MSLMSDPVVAADGHSYEREAITKWIRSRGCSPLTKAPLSLDMLVPNLNLKQQIEEFRMQAPSVLSPGSMTQTTSPSQ